jgi:hypothetical protein
VITCVSFCVSICFLLSIHLHVELLSHMIALCLPFEELLDCFPKGLPSVVCEGSIFSISFLGLIIVCAFKCTFANMCEMASQRVFFFLFFFGGTSI